MTYNYSQISFLKSFRRFIFTFIYRKKKYPFLLVAFTLLNFLFSNIYAQTCSTTSLYDAVSSAYHQSVAKKSDGTWATWGQLAASNGTTAVLSPQIINSTNYSSLTGVPLLATTASSGGGANEQSILLTTTGLFAWGKEDVILSTSLTTNDSFQKLTINSKADGLPTGVLPADVTMLFAMNNTLAILTSSGNAYVISKGSTKVLGDGSSSLDANWHQVKTALNTPLTNIIAIRGQVSSASEGALMALTNDNKVYTWGETIYKGDGSNSTSANYAVEMTLPSGTSSTPKMIGVTGGSNTTGNKNSFFILYSNGSLYSLGLNDLKQLGDRTTTEQKSWVSVKDPSGNPFTNVKTISVQEHDSKIPAGALITNDGKLYVWGQGERSMLGGLAGATVTSDPFLASGSDVAKLVEFGGHTLVYVKEGSSKFCYVGHKVSGSMGDGTNTDIDVATFDCTSTPTIDICGAVTPLDAGSIGANQSICFGVTPTSLISTVAANGGTGLISYQWQSSTDNITFTDIANATNTVYTPNLLTQTTYYRRGAYTSTDAVLYSNVVTITIIPTPTVTSQPSSSVQNVCLNQPATSLSLSVSGGSGITYQWYSNTSSSTTNGTLLAGATNSSYTPLTSTVGTLYYYCVISYTGCATLNTASQTITSNISGAVTVGGLPSITSQPSSSLQNVCLNQPATSLSLSVSGGSGITYQWYSNTSSSTTNGTLLAGATNSSYTPLTSTVGTLYYYCVISYTGCATLNIASQTITSNISGAVTVGGLPSITSQPSSSLQNVCLNQPATSLSLSVSGGSGITYQWYSNTSSSTTNGTLLAGATNSSYTPLTSTVGTLYYYCVISYTGCATLSIISQTITSNISGAVTVGGLPSITSQPSSSVQNVCLNQPATSLSLSVSGGSGITYQWYSNTSSSTTNGTLLAGATNSSYTPLTSTVGTLYYYCVISYTGCATLNTASQTITSNISGAVTVGGLPSITSQPSSSLQNVCLNQPATSLSLSVSGGSGITYQWYSNTSSSTTNGTLLAGATNSSYTPLTSTVGTLYYYCVISYTGCATLNTASQTITSNISGAVTVGGLPSITSQPSSSLQNVCLNQPATSLSLSVSGGSGITYQWYSNTSSSTTNGTLLAGATNSSYTPLTSTVGTLYYYCVISYTGCATLNTASQTITSNISGAVTVGGLPSITSQPSSSLQNVCLNQPATSLSLSVSGGSGITYQWYSNTSSSTTNGTLLAGATNSSYTPLTSTVGTLYYYCVISYTGCATLNIASQTLTTNVSGGITVTICSSPPSISQISNQTINRNSSTPTLAFTVSDIQTPATSLVVNVSSSDTTLMPRSRIVLGGSDSNRTIKLTPILGNIGSSQITVSVTDSDNLTSSSTFTLTVTANNPTIGVLPDQTINVSTSTPSRNFVLRSDVASISINGSSSNTTLVPNTNIFFTGTGNNRSIVITPTPGLLGSSLITIEVNYQDGSTEYIVFTLTVVNTAPYLSPLRDVRLCLSTVATVPFIIGDNETPTEDLTLTITSSNETILARSEIQVIGTGQNKTLKLSPASQLFGSSIITIKVTDNAGATSTQNFTFTLNPCDGDNDGIPDQIECPDFINCPDTDGDGIPNYLDTDSDNDGIADNVEKNIDSDGDGTPDYLDFDSDNDGIPDAVEGYIDSDGDGIMNYLDLDSDGDSIEDKIESYSDADKDGIPNYLDIDSDGDGIEDKYEGLVDTDGDGFYDFLDGDSDNDGIPDGIEGQVNNRKPIDSDNDGKPDYIDLDSDNDGIPDKIEKVNIIIFEGKIVAQPADTDGDGTPDYLDLDSDNDGIPDNVEAGKNPNAPVDTDGDGKPDYLDLDSDNDGIPDNVEAGKNPNAPVDTDADGIPDYLDLDSDNDGIPDNVEAGKNPNIPVDTDGDGKPDYLDLDSDNDGIPDNVEAGKNPNAPVDTDGDGKPDYLDLDSDNDGIPDNVEAGKNPNAPVDTDADGKPDYLDLDSDNDGIPDNVEAGKNPNAPVDTDGDGKPDYLDLDSDNDGIPDNVEAGKNPSTPVDTDGDGKPDYLDLDSDNDGIPDNVEAGKNPNAPVDTDADGIPDYLDLDSDNDSIPDNVEAGKNPNAPVDTDGDGKPDYLDLDSDNDSIPDNVEAGKNPNAPVDTDGDGKPDYLDIDSDNDDIPDSVEAGNNPNVPVDTDGDGFMNFRDTDSDNDKILDKLEDNLDYGNLSDCDKDGVPNYIDADQCETFTPEGISPNGDGRNDVLIIPGIKAKNNNRIAIYNRWGSLVYEKENYQNDWGGEANVKNIVLESDGLLPDGTYYYVVVFDDKQAAKAGFIYVNRLNN